MKNETEITYTATETTKEERETVMDARIKLVGSHVPGVRITCAAELATFCTGLIGDSACEEFHLICVDCQCRVICESMISTGTIGACDAPIAKIAQVALLSNCYAVFLTHNHPGGTCAPSSEDIASTLQIKKGLDMFGIRVLDHMIVANGNGTYSLVGHGDLR